MRFLAMAFLLVSTATRADEISVAVAANFSAPIEKIAKQFKEKTGHEAKITLGSTGKFYSQIQNGAPFDILLAADIETPTKLVKENLAIKDSQYMYAIGKLALWSTNKKLNMDNGKILLSTNVKHIAMANPKLAPYGAAAMETLIKLKMNDLVKDKIVIGENIAQTFQLTSTSNAKVGFVALSQVPKEDLKSLNLWIVPQDNYSPLKQDAIILKNGETKKASKEFLEFLKTKEATSIIKDYGYDI